MDYVEVHNMAIALERAHEETKRKDEYRKKQDELREIFKAYSNQRIAELNKE
jgi:hypothetical protein